MNCRRIEKLIPLYVEGDIGEHDASPLQSHLQSCAACRALVAEYEASQAWLRAAEPDFDAAFVDTIRAGVMRELAASEAAPPFVERLRRWLAPRRLAAVTAALVVILMALLIYSGRSRVHHRDDQIARQPVSPVEKQNEGLNPAPEAKLKAGDQPKRHLSRRLGSALAKDSPRNVRRARTPQNNLVAQQPLHLKPAVPVDDRPATKGAERLRIDIQTADPNIRIIWFAPKSNVTGAPKPMGDTL
jgi:hypothetical protein